MTISDRAQIYITTIISLTFTEINCIFPFGTKLRGIIMPTAKSQPSESVQINSVYTFRYEGNVSYIDLMTLVNSQTQFKIMLDEIQGELIPERKLQIKVGAIQKGSFELHLLFNFVDEMLPLAPFVFSANTAESIGKILSFLKTYFDLRKLLKGKRPTSIKQKGENILIQGDGNSITVTKNEYKFYINNSTIDSAVKKNFQYLNSDPNIDSIKILKKNKTLIEVKRNSFESLSAPNEILEKDVKEEIIDTALLITRSVLKPERGMKWSFILIDQRRPINATVSDHAFNEDIHSGKFKFGAGDALLVKLKITKEYDPKYGLFVEKKFEVIEVAKIIDSLKQINLDLR